MIHEIQCPEKYRKSRPLLYNDLVHIGRQGDGGYVVPDIATIYNLFALGLDHDISFEQSWRENSNAKIYGFCNAGVHYKDHPFDYLDNNCHVDENNIQEVMSHIEGKFFYKMDIEAGEWSIIRDVLSNPNCVGGVMECHTIEQTEDFKCVDRSQKFIDFLDYLQKDYRVVHLHFNNLQENPAVADVDSIWRAVEMTIMRKNMCPADEVYREKSLTEFDSKNVIDHPEINCVF